MEPDKIGGEAERLLAVNYSEAFYERTPTTVPTVGSANPLISRQQILLANNQGVGTSRCTNVRAANGMSLSSSRDTSSRALYQEKRDSANE